MNEKKGWDGSFTVEASVIFSLFFLIMVVFICLFFWMHDMNIALAKADYYCLEAAAISGTSNEMDAKTVTSEGLINTQAFYAEEGVADVDLGSVLGKKYNYTIGGKSGYLEVKATSSARALEPVRMINILKTLRKKS